MQLPWIEPTADTLEFPPISEILSDPEGLLAAGGDLSPERLLYAYRHGIFPWYEKGQPILWWCPNPRAVIYSKDLRISRSLRKSLRNKPYTVTIDQAFEAVIRECAGPRRDASGTWITDDMQQAYIKLHQRGHAHSVEVWDEDGKLVGGLYGILLERLFCGESMFSHSRDMSKVALVYLAQWLAEKNIGMIDCQLPNPHLMSMGAVEISRDEFLKILA